MRGKINRSFLSIPSVFRVLSEIREEEGEKDQEDEDEVRGGRVVKSELKFIERAPEIFTVSKANTPT